MSKTPRNAGLLRAKNVTVTEDTLEVFLEGGGSLSVPVRWYPRLTYASSYELGNWRLIGDGEGIHWPELDEDVRVDALAERRPSDESSESLDRWLRSRRRR